jgi:bifunctional DNase/RNase
MGRLSRIKWCLLGCLIVGLVFIGVSVVQPGRLTNAVKQVANNDFAYKIRALTEREAIEEPTLVEMVIDTVGMSEVDTHPIVVLKEKAGERYLIISIGLAEANAIAVITEGIDVPRPLTSDLLCSIMNRLGVRVKSIIVNDIRDSIFYANVILKANWTEMKIDSRPSDAIAIALRANAPIYVEEAVLAKAGIKPPQDSNGHIVMQVEADKPGVNL